MNLFKLSAFERIDDGEMFTLNDDGETYSLEYMKKHYPDSLQTKYTMKQLERKEFKPIYERV